MSNPYDRANPFNTGTRADTFGIRPDLFKELQEVAPKKETIDRLVESEQALKDRMDLLDPIMDYGQSYMPTGFRFTGTGKMPFRNQRGPARGVVIENDGLRLLGEGAWQISCTVFASWVLAISGVGVMVEIRCYTPTGTLYSYQKHRTGTDSNHSIDFSADFVVPGPDYFISVHVTQAASSREFPGGWAITRLAAKRWSSQFINPHTGGAAEGDA